MVARTDVNDPGPDRNHGARGLVAEDCRDRLTESPVGEREIRVAHTGGREPDVHLARRRRRKLDIFDRQRRVGRLQDGGANHGWVIRLRR